MSQPEGNEKIIDGKYRIEKLLGKGGMGSVHLATHIGTGRPVALKLIAPQFMRRDEFVQRFQREAQAAGRLRHPNVVDVTDFGFSVDEDGQKTAYLVMEYLDGCALGEVLEEESKLPLDFTVDIIEQVCSAVGEAHRQGIIHRDLKPDNIWLEPNQRGGYTVKVLDFGIAKLEESSFQVPDSGEYLVRDVSQPSLKTSRQTVADTPRDETILESEHGTQAGEGSTIAMPAEGETMALPSEDSTGVLETGDDKGTLIQDISGEDASPLEAGTLIADSASSTGEHGLVDEKGTRLIQESDETEDDEKLVSTSDLTRAGAVLGTPLYMSPEQCRGEKLTPQSDIYALGVIVYQLLSGKLPFNGDYVKVMDGHKEEQPPELEVKKVPKRLKGVVMDALGKDALERPETAEVFASKMRANSEGLGWLFRRALVVYGQHIQKFLLLTLICFAPVISITAIRVTIGLLIATNVIQSETVSALNAIIGGVLAFCAQIVTSAFLFGMTTWIVGRTITFPLRPVSIRSAIREVRKRWKALAWSVSLSTLCIFTSMAVGVIIIGLSAVLLGLLNVPGLVLVGAGIGIVLALLLISFVNASLMMVASSVMMEGVSGFKAFKRSYRLFRRWTPQMMGVAAFNFLVPVILAIFVAVAVASVIQLYDLRNEVAKMKKEGVVAEKDLPKEEKEAKEKDKRSSLNFSVGNKGVRVNSDEAGNQEKEEDDVRKRLTAAIQEAVFELLWIPISSLILSFTTVLIALIYFKLRQAGGETPRELLDKLEGEYQIEAKWEQSIRERLVQSGKISNTV